jgi:hypothetical protein
MPDTTTPHSPHAAADDMDAQLRLIAGALVAPAAPAPELDDVDFGRVVTRTDAARRRRVVIPAAVAAAILLIAGVVALAGGGWSDNADHADVASSQPPTDPGLAAPQRMLLRNWWGDLPADGGAPVKMPLAGLDPHGSPRYLANGDLVVVGIHPVDEPVPDDFDEMTDLVTGLAVVSPDGQAVVERTIATSSLLGITDTEAILLRSEGGEPTEIVGHDLASGTERAIAPVNAPDGERTISGPTVVANGEVVGVSGFTPDDTDADGYLPRPEDYPPCRLTRVDLADGTPTATDTDLECGMVVAAQASPDGTQVAVAYEPGGEPLGGTRVAVIDIVDGDVAYDEAVDIESFSLLGMAWDDDTTLRLAHFDGDDYPGWNFDEDDLPAEQVLVDEITVD